jgi:PKD repeat protein
LELPWRRDVPGITVLLGFLLASCGGEDLTLPSGGGEGGEPAAIRVVTGDGQSAQVGALLTAPVVVEVTDAEGLPVEGATVAFELTSAGDGAEISPATATTDAEGHAEARVLLGSKVGMQTGEARVIVEGGAVPKTSFSAVATPNAPGNPPPEPNKAPKADFDVHCSRLTCTFVDKSKDDDGVIVSWQWSFGDGATSSERHPVHTYGEEGKYDVLLVVTDDRGATDAKIKDADAKER